MNDEYARYVQSRGYKNTSALGCYLQMEACDMIDKYIIQKRRMTTSEMIGSALAVGLVKAFSDILKDMFD